MTLELPTSRPYRGVSHEERRAERRQRLIDAAVEVYGGQGYRQASVKSVCAAAGLTERYFYESFGNSEELLVAAYDTVIRVLVEEIIQADEAAAKVPVERAYAMLHAYFTALKRDPRSAQVFLVEIRGVSQAVTDRYTAALLDISRKMVKLFSKQGQQNFELLALGVVGGISEIALYWIQQGYVPAIEDVIDVALELASKLLEKT